MKRCLIILFIFFILTLSGQFQRKTKLEELPEKNTSQENIETHEDVNQSFISKNTEQQRKLRVKIASSLREFKTNTSKKVLLISLLLAFLYGVIHSLGPGHGKVFLVSQVIGSEVNFRAIVGSSLFFAFLHSLSGMTLVVILKVLSMKILQDSTKVSMIAQNISFVILIALGLFILIRSIKGNSGNHHKQNQGNLFLTALMIGFVPCPGSIIISVFAMKMGTYSLGIFMILAMALGMASTLIILNGITLLAKSFATKAIANQDNIRKISRVMTMIGSTLLIVLGTLFLTYSIYN